MVAKPIGEPPYFEQLPKGSLVLNTAKNYRGR